MNEDLPKYLRMKDGSIFYNGDGEFAFFVPEIFFSRNHAIVEGDIVWLIGTITYSKNVKKPEDLTVDVKRFFYPSAFATKPNRMEKVKNLKILGSKADDYRVLYYGNNDTDQIITSVEIPEELSNTEEFFSIFVNTGKVPAGIAYDKLDEYYSESMELNGGSFGLSQQSFGQLVAELCRDPEDLSRPYRLSKAYARGDMYSYVPVSIKAVAKLVSPFTSLVTENWDEAVVNASIIGDTESVPTPMEPIMTGDL